MATKSVESEIKALRIPKPTLDLIERYREECSLKTDKHFGFSKAVKGLIDAGLNATIGEIPPRACLACKEQFKPSRGDKLYCGQDCRKRYKARAWHSDPENKAKAAIRRRERYLKQKEKRSSGAGRK